MKWSVVVVAAVAVCGAPGVGWAQSGDVARARALVKEGNAAWQRGDDVVAALKWADAYALSGEPELLYRVGQACERRGNLELAARYMQAYLDAEPGAVYRAAIEAHIKALRGRVKAGEQAWLDVSSQPAGATVQLDGMQEQDATPVAAPVAPGAVVVALTHPDYPGVVLREEVIAAPGQTTRYKAQFGPRKPVEEPQPAEPQPVEPAPVEPAPAPAPPVSDEPALTVVDIRPPTGVYILGWTGLIVGSLVTTVAGLVDYADFGNELTPVWVGGAAVMGLSGYLMFGYDWADDLPRVSASPADVIPAVRTINLKFEF